MGQCLGLQPHFPAKGKGPVREGKDHACQGDHKECGSPVLNQQRHCECEFVYEDCRGGHDQGDADGYHG